MLRKLRISLIFSIIALLSAFVFPWQLTVSASDEKHNVFIDYNATEIIQFLPANLSQQLSNAIVKVNDGDTISLTALTDTLNCFYKCTWFVNGSAVDLNNYTITKDVNLTARWTPVEYTIHYNYINGEDKYITNLQQQKKYTIEDGRIDFYRPERPNYIFVDWYTSSSLADQFLSIYKTEYGIGDIYLYAKWKPVEFKINYNTDAYNIDNPPTYNIEHDGFMLADAKKDGYSFDGWYLDKEFTTKCTKIDKSFSGDLNLYPKFIPNVYTVTYIMPDGGKSVIKAEHGTTCALPEINKSIFEIIKTDKSRENITSDTTINIVYVNIWYVYLISALILFGITALIVCLIIKKRKNIHRLRYVYSGAKKKDRRWR